MLPSRKVQENIFVVEEDIEGGYVACAVGESIFTQANDLETLKMMVKDAVKCHFFKNND
ncbi:2-oxoisovalerate dehydrogenase E1 subunit beta [Pseudocalidococcus azoricus]|uniref:2-oxoisovalerate dehydrogenase E1 subunit beta n=1 Tax=Pseudocalidococcus azoricus TaxID=3110322 RepID=UPI00389A8561